LKLDEQDDWVNFYVNIFLDRDMLMRHFGYGVGHMQYERQQEIGLKIVPGGINNNDDDDVSETEGLEREEQIDNETEDDEESEQSSGDSDCSSESDAGGYASP